MYEFEKATINLFNTLPIENVESGKLLSFNEAFSMTFKFGYFIGENVLQSYPKQKMIDVINFINKNQLNGEKLNSTFHKSWNKIKKAPIQQLIFEQFLHYFTTYGFEAFGIEDDFIFIPKEKLEIPKIDFDEFRFVVIKGCYNFELISRIIELSKIALKEETLKDCMTVIQNCSHMIRDKVEFVESIKNKELRSKLNSEFKLIPTFADDFLRYVLEKMIGSSMLIKDRRTIEGIENASSLKKPSKYFKKYLNQFSNENIGYKRLGAIFNRYKPLFLAFKKCYGDNHIKMIINKIGRFSKKYHRPMPEDYFNNFTSKLSKDSKIVKDEFEKELEKINVFRKARLLYALKYRSKERKSIVYKIRNGRSFATEMENNKIVIKNSKKYYDIILKDVADNDVVKGKKIFIPQCVHYSLPSSEKQFIGNIPMGTKVVVEDSIILGVHWNNVDGNRIDLDLSGVSMNGKVGWDGAYRDGDMLFSGDITDARCGATEAFFVKSKNESSYLFNLNYYNYNDYNYIGNLDVPFFFFIAEDSKDNLEKNYIVDQNKVIFKSNLVQDVKQKALGVLVNNDGKQEFYIVETKTLNSISARENEHAQHMRNYFFEYYADTISLNELLAINNEMVESSEDADIDLTPHQLGKDTILNLFISE